ncbi:cell division protein FtsQ/DivIB [Nitrospirillum sp. BR 11163]|uniref:cell division protein FtsQ/DivIB n=1 Tax=Nitrospirillum sp. BR 11163 TaxID=3104323 RepID=UPI002AFFF7DB|nr:cell division protein FtsQ/DivIB [Nitrospirillum sp. BR 11163]MEA1676886.1 FtsQ-type POTRA domain-containing protein [Nitrospirillum sp. BR 11163]
MPRVTHPSSPGLFPEGDSPRSRIAYETRRTTQKAAQAANRRRAVPRWQQFLGRRATVIVPLALVGGLVLWGWASGKLAAAGNAVDAAFLDITARGGLQVQEVLVKGRKETDGAQVLAALGVERGSPILGFDPHAARKQLEQIPWIASARIERRLPDTLFVVLTERQPMAIWQHEQKLALVDAEGTVLTDHNLDHFPNLPILVGEGAPKQGRALLAALASEPTIQSRVDAAVLVGARRWDLHLKGGLEVRLPEVNYEAAVHQLAALEASDKILERDVVAIDLRVPDRLVVQSSPAAIAAKAAAKAADKKRQAAAKKN